MNISVDIQKQFQKALTSWTDEVVAKVETVMQEVANETADRMKPAGDFKNRSGKYRKSWKAEKIKSRTYTKATVYASKNQAYKTMLLEFGHAKRGGGRTKAFPHISVNNDWAEEEAYKRIIKIIEGG